MIRRRDCLAALPATWLAASADPAAAAQPDVEVPHDVATELVHRYCRALDRLDPVLLAACFHEDAVIDMGSIYQGPPGAFVEVAIRFMRGMAATRHLVGNVLRIGSGFESYVDAWHLVERDGAWRELVVRGRYIHRASLRSGRWALSYHGEVIDYGREQPSDRIWFDGRIGLPRGARDASDASSMLLLQEREAR
ncbi:MAG: nuclear transport factor 2 family protein [Allosphingosinicella sp.]